MNKYATALKAAANGLRHAAVLLGWSLLMPGGAAQAAWIEVDRSEIQITYADPATMEVSGSRISMWSLSSYTTPKKYDGKKFQSVMSQYEYDCKAEQLRTLAYSLRAGKGGDGTELHGEENAEKWKRVPKGTVDEKLWNKVCTPDAGWNKVGESNAMSVYANPFLMRKRGDKVKMWELFDLKAAQERSDGRTYLSLKHQAEYDCKARQYRTLVVEYHSDGMGKGKEIASDEKAKPWEPVETGSADELFWKMTCGSE